MRNYHYLTINVRWIFFTCLLVCLISGCADRKKVKKDPFYDKWKVMAEESKGYSPVAKRRAVNLPDSEKKKSLSRNKIKAYTKQLPSKRITLKIHNTGLDTLLRSLARAVEQNILINDKIKGRISINVKNARWDQLFQGILASHGLTYVWEGEIIRVMTIDDLERDLKRESQKKDLRMVEPLVTKIISIDYTDAKKLKDNLESFLTVNNAGKSIGSVIVDEHTNALVIQAVSDDIEKMISLIEELDKPTSQVLIEAHIVETTKETARELGIQWGGLVVKDGGVNHYITPGVQGSGGLGSSLGTAIDPSSGMVANFPVSLEETAGFSIGYIGENIGNNILSLQLSALQKEGKLNILSSPSITTIDNQKAIIESGSEVPFQTVEDGEVKIEFKKAVLSLEVEPHIIDGETLKMQIKTSKDELDFAHGVQGNPAIITKRAETNVILLDGQTTVIGGLNKEINTDLEGGVPFLKEIPLIGFLFRNTSKTNSMEEVLIFITPHILKEKMEEDVAIVVNEIDESQGQESIIDPKPIVLEGQLIPDKGPVKNDQVTENDSSMLGRILVGRMDTLSEMIRTVYGEYNPKYKKAVVAANPHIHDPDVIDIGEIVNFPAISVSVNPIIKDAWWIKLGEKEKLEDAFDVIRDNRGGDLHIRIIPHYNERTGLKIVIVLNEYYFNKSAAVNKLEKLKKAGLPEAEVLSLWDEETVYFADPAKVK